MTYILLRSGRYLDLTAPDPALVNVSDVAHALARLCRFTGHATRFYSVAEHCVRASYLVPPEDALVTLLHDATEAYLGDVSSPLKGLLPEYRVLEERMHRAIAEAFGLPETLPASVKAADLRMLAAEAAALLPPPVAPGPYHEPGAVYGWPVLRGVTSAAWGVGPEPGWLPNMAESKFLHRYYDLTGRAPR